MRQLILGTAGHIDHGKTTLVQALTGIDTDRLPEEKRRGITIDLGFAPLTFPSGVRIGIVDVPGHEAFVRNMLAGATGVDIALLVVAADESVMPQTSEHLAILELLGVRGGVIALTKTDLVDDEWLELVRSEVRQTASAGPLADAPIVPVSARTGAGLNDLIRALEDAAASVADRDRDDLFRLPIDRIFSVRGTGTVVTGTVWSGTMARDRVVRLLPADRAVRVRAVQAFGQDRDQVWAGERAAIALAGITREDATRGDVLVTGAGWQPSSMLTVKVKVLPGSERPLRARQRVRFHLGTAEILGRVAPLERLELQPGEEGWVQLRLEAPVVARARDRFVLRSYSPVTTIAGGIVAEPTPPKRKRLAAVERDALNVLLESPPAAAVAACVERHGQQGIETVRLPILSGLPQPIVREALANTTAFLDLDGTILAKDAALDYRDRILASVDRHHLAEPLSAGASHDELRRETSAGAAPALFAWALQTLVHQAAIVAEGGHVRRTDFAPNLSPDQQRIAEQLIQTFNLAGLAPPTLAELPAGVRDRPDFDRLLRHLERRGDLVNLAQGQWISGPVLGQAVLRVRANLAPGPTFTTSDFKELFGLTRKYLIPLLEHLDRTGVTVRRGDLREVTPASQKALDPVP